MKPILIRSEAEVVQESCIELERDLSQKYGTDLAFRFSMFGMCHADRDSNTNSYVASAAPC